VAVATDAGSRALHRGILGMLCWGALALGVGGCEGEPPSLMVGPVGFTAQDLGALDAAQQSELAVLTAFGLVVAGGETEAATRPQVARDLRSIVLQQLAMELAADQAGLGEEQLRQAYDSDPRHELVVRHLVILSERWRPAEHRDSARAAATAARDRARAGEPFEELAGEYSDEPGAAERGGLLRPGREGSWVPEFWSAASALEVGEVSPVVETEFGFHVLKLEERRRVPFEEVRDEVLRDVTDLPEAVGRAGSWARERMEAARLDTAMIRGWMEGMEPSDPLVRWADSLGVPALQAEELASFRHGAPDGRLEALREEGLERVVEFVWSAAQTHLMVHHAREMGISPSRSQRLAIDARWRDRMGRWAEALGFEEGYSRERVKEQALQVLGSPAQSVAMARAEMESISATLRTLYPVSRPADSVRATP